MGRTLKSRVFDGEKWRNFGPLDGPLGERVFAIATSPVDGDVWIGTDVGLSRYSLKNDTWLNYSRAHGLVSDQISCLAFDSAGNLYCGTQTDGLAIGRAEGDFARWENVRGAEEMPDASAGEGLPSNLINDVLVADDDTIYVATTNGLARSKNFGESWTYLRGGDWKAKLEGQYRPTAPREPKENLNRELLREDYVTNLAEDERGLLWLGYRQKGFEIRRPLSDRIAYISAKKDTDRFPYASTLLPLGDGRTLIASYGEGLTLAPAVPVFVPTKEETGEAAKRRGWKQLTATSTKPMLPSPAAPPTREELIALTNQARALETPLESGEASVLDDDWTTQGDWVGRYGDRWAVMCAVGAPLNHYFQSDLYYQVAGFTGPHASPDDSLRHWMHWKKSADGRVLYDPILGYRRQAEWDDHGEAYPMSHNGPDVWIRVKVPRGTHRMSLYFFNKDGHQGFNRARDYLLEIYPEADTIAQAMQNPVLARARVRDFWGGVYKRFLVSGSAHYWVRVAKNHSFNTIVSAVTFDKVGGPPNDFSKIRSPWLAQNNYTLPPVPAAPFSDPTVQAARELWAALDVAQTRSGGEALQTPGRILAIRALSYSGWGAHKPTLAQRERGANPQTQALLKNWRWQVPLWNAPDRAEFADAMQAGWQNLKARTPGLVDDDR